MRSVFAQAREKARATACLSNLKQIGLASQMYASDYDDGLPAWNEYYGKASKTDEGGSFWGDVGPSGYWQAKLQPYIKNGDPNQRDNSGMWKCPSLGSKGERSIDPVSKKPSYSYGLSQVFMYSNMGNFSSLGGSANQYYRYPSLVQMDAPASTIMAGECGDEGRLHPPWWFNYWVKHAYQFTREIPDRHSGGANYIFADGHAKWLNREAAYPSGPVNTANRKRSYQAVINFFAYDEAERAAFRSLL